MNQAVVLHDHRHQRTATQQPDLAADVKRPGTMVLADRNDDEAKQRDVIHGLSRTAELLNFGGMLPQAPCNALGRPAKALTGFDGHQPMHDLRKDVSGGEADDVLVFDPVLELLPSSAIARMCREVLQ
jgi:hypothetical protein